MADDLVVRLKAEDELSDRLKDAQKSVRDLKKELVAAAKEADSTGDYSRVKELEGEFRAASKRVGELRGELKQLQRDSKSTSDSTVKNAGAMKTAWSKLQKVMQNPLVTAVSIGAVTLFAKSAIQSFSEVQDASDALTATFGATGDNIISWANESALAFNLSRKEALSAAQTIAVFGDSAGLAGEELEQFTISLTERAADAASFFGGTTQQAIEAFGAALRGEMEPIRRYAVMLDDARLRAKAFEMGLIETTKQALTPQQKTLAAYNAIMEQTTRVQGDVARTSDSMANQIKQSQAQMENFKTSVGETLAVALKPILEMLNNVMGGFNKLSPPIKTAAITIGLLGTAALIVGPRIATMVAQMKAAGITATTMKTKMAAAGTFLTGPWGVAIAAATVIIGAFASAQADAQAQAEALVDTLDEQTGAITELTRTKLGEEFLKNFSIEDLEKTPFTLREIVDASLEGGAALESLRGRVEEWSAATLAGDLTQLRWLSSFQSSMEAAERDGKAMRELAKLQDYATEAAEDNLRATDRLTRASDDMVMTQGRVNRVLREAGRVIPTRPLSAYEQAVRDAASATRDADRATDELREGLSLLSGAISTWGAKQNFKQALKTFLEDPTVDAAVAMVSAMETAASSIEDPGEAADFSITAIGKIKQALKDEGIKLPPAVREAMQGYETDANNTKAAVDRINAALDALERTRRVQVIIETRTSRVPSGGTPDTDNDPTKRHGGWVGGSTGGPTSDTVRTWLSRGEYVLRGGAASALHAALGDSGMWALNHADRSMPSFLDAALPPITVEGGGPQPALVGAGAPVINIGEIKADSGIDVQTEVMWALRRADRIKRERG